MPKPISFLLAFFWWGFLGGVMSFPAQAQEISPIQAFSPKEYGAENQNWAIAQGPDKRIYIANNAGLLRYNGEQWELFPTPNQTILRSVHIVGKRIYTGCYREFGFWTENHAGQLIYSSISQKIKVPLEEDEQFWRIISQGQSIVFQSLNRLYLYDEGTKRVKIVQAPATITKTYVVGGDIFFQVLHHGLYKLIEGRPVLFSSSDLLLHEEIIEMVAKTQGVIWFVTQKKGIWAWNNGNFTPILTSDSRIVQQSSIYSAHKLRNGDLVLGTISHGIHILNEKGNWVRSLTQIHGLSNNTILSLMEDVDQSIWLGTDNGISVVNRQSPIQVYHDVGGRIGTVYAAQEVDELIYIGSNQGLFVKSKKSDSDFQLIPGTNGQVWCLKKIGSDLFCGHHAGTFLIQGMQARLISTLPGTWDLKPFPHQPNRLLQGTYKGLSVLEKENGQWKVQAVKGLPTLSCRYFEWLDPTEILVNHEYKGVFKLTFSPDYQTISQIQQEQSAPIGLKSGLVSFQNDIFYFSEKGVFRYDQIKGFVLTSEITAGLLGEDKFFSGKLIPDPKGNRMWAFTEHNVISITPNPIKKGLIFQKFAIPFDLRQDRAGYENATLLNNAQLLLGSTNGYLLLNPQVVPIPRFQVRLQSVSKENRVINAQLLALDQAGSLSSDERSIGFRFFVPSFSKYEPVWYRTKLEGMYDDWTEWSTESDVRFDNLPPGNYTFQVMAKQHNQLAENTAMYEFTISYPWYATVWAKILYALLGGALLVAVNRLSRQYYQQQQKKVLETSQQAYERMKMESEQKVMQLQNQQLVTEIDNKNRELTLSTMSIIKKNEILHEIKRALQQVERPQDAERVAQLIDENLNDTKDWEFLEEAFNHADKDFLRKLKTSHPDLTPNDLRFCAYLRLNLSSKEIAPLLNISVRSVEIKRYRIRKKMDLRHENSLVDYILSI